MKVLLGLILVWGPILALGHVVANIPVSRARRLSPERLRYDGLTPNNRTLCPETPETRPPERTDTTERLAALRDEMIAAETLVGPRDLDAYLVYYGDEHGSGGVAHDMRLNYISGFTGSNGFAIILKDKAGLWTDGRYFTQGDRQMDCNWILMEEGMEGYPTPTEYLRDQLSSGANVAADPKFVGISDWQEYETELALDNINMLEVTSDLIDNIWTSDRDPKPNKEIYEHTIDYAGESWQDKVKELRSELNDLADVLMITALDETAWLFNLRGSDYPTSPLFYSYAMLMQNETRLYLTRYQDLIAPLLEHLNTNADGTCNGKEGDCVLVREYSTALSDLADLEQEFGSISVTPSSRYAVYSSAGDRRKVDLSPMQLQKSVKNEVERRRYYECQVRDSAKLVEFIAFLEPLVQAGEEWTEITTAQKLTEIRSEDPAYHMDSFNAISAVGENAAVIHYRADEDTDTALNTDEVYLLDSGGNYLDGTTDVTRTFHFGTPKAIEIDAYTRVLVGVIELATTVWPVGLLGSEIDARTRNILWQNGWDYNHGTGHGIGYFLNVHEGPGRIAMGYNPEHSPLYEGMFFSDEPGYYEVGEYGIRLESIMGIEDADTPNNFNDKQYLTFNAATLVPFEPHLIDYSMLNQKHREWLNAYNRRCREETGELLRSQDKTEAYDWLMARTEHIPAVPQWEDPVSGSSTTLIPGRLMGALAAAAVMALL